MTRQSAIERLLYIWLVGGGLLGLLLLMQAVSGKYGEDDFAAWSWFLAIVVAPFSLLAVAAFVDARAHWRNAAANKFKYRVAFWASISMQLLALFTLLAEPIVTISWYDLFSRTGVFFGLSQAAVMAAIGAVVFDRR